MKSIKFLFSLCLFFISIPLAYSFSQQAERQEQLFIIPNPNKIEFKEGYFDLSQIIVIKSKRVLPKTVNKLTDYLNSSSFCIFGRIKTIQKDATLELLLEKNSVEVKSLEGYILEINEHEISLKARTEKGLFYGIQTLLQISNSSNNQQIPCVKITDYPRFQYRGLHLDVSRHFFSVNFIKKQLELMAYFKLNRFHWHLTDGPGWRLEIKKYPLLTQIGAFRTHKSWQSWWATNPRKYVDSKKNQVGYGGFYTQKEAREIVEFAKERNITVIPEIEMPGHSEEVLAIYPHLACTNAPYTQSEFCIGNDSTFIFLKDVLSEVIDIFPSKYIHIGGDEADKSHWHKCPKCQQRIREENLKNEEELQSYLIKRIEKFLESKNRKLLGWDEILEGGLAPKAVVMSWRSEQGGIKAIKQGHKAIMTPSEYCYFDSYQANPIHQPKAIGGFLPLKKVYHYNPISTKITTKEQKQILGVQANLWTEYISTEKHLEYMLYPRLLALSEVAWTMQKNKNWNDFKRRTSEKIGWLRKNGVNSFELSNEIKIEHQTDTINKGIRVLLSTEKHGYRIRYKTDSNSQSFKFYSKPFLIKDSANIVAQLIKDSIPIESQSRIRLDYHKGVGKKVFYSTAINKYYSANGEKTLVDGQKGGFSHKDNRWQGFIGQGVDVTIDLESVTDINTIRANFMQNKQVWIYLPKQVSIFISNDNIHFKGITTIQNNITTETDKTLFYEFQWKGKEKARYIRYKATPNSIKGSWIFLDEIVIW